MFRCPPRAGRNRGLLAGYREQGLDFHALRTRQAGSRAFVTLHVLVPGHWTVQKGTTGPSASRRTSVAPCLMTHVTTHLEPLEDPVSMIDQGLDRPPA
jgi:divalent metal cation (Fe/Co/Zn/Cd) transporter